MSKIYCACCSRRIVYNNPDSCSSEKWITYHEARANFGNTVFCRICAKDLDENGMFPEDY